MNPLAQALELLQDADDADDRAAALALVVLDEASPADLEVARFVAHRHHLIVRGGAATLLREALSEPEGSSVRAAAAALSPELVCVLRTGSTRPRDDGRLRTLETGGSNVGGVAFSADGTFLYTFVWGSAPGRDDVGGDSRFQQWRAETGELVRQAAVGQFREEAGAFAVSPDGRTLAVRSHRDLAIYDLHAWRGQPLPPLRHRLSGYEGPYTITFLDDEHLIADDSSAELVVWNFVTGQRVAVSHAIGWRGHAVAPDGSRLLLGGCIQRGRMVGVHALPSLELEGCFADVEHLDGSRLRSEAIAISPSGQRVVTGDTAGAVTLWAARQLHDRTRQSSPREPTRVTTCRLGRHTRAVTAVRFVDEGRLLTGDASGVVLDWQIEEDAPLALDLTTDPALDPARGPAARATASPRRLLGHRGDVSAIAVHPRGSFAATSAEDGLVILWDLAGTGAGLPGPVPPMRQARRCRPHADGVEVVTDGASQVVARPGRPRATSAAAPIVPQDPDLCGVNVGELAVVPVDEPGPPQLRVLRGGVVADVVELDDHCAGLCALEGSSFAVVEGDGHVSFWDLLSPPS